MADWKAVVHIVVSRQLVDLSIDCFVEDRVSLSVPTFCAAIRANCDRDIHSARDVSLACQLSERQFLHCFDDHSAPAKIANASFVRHGPKPIWTARSLPDLGLPACKAVHIFRKNAQQVQDTQADLVHRTFARWRRCAFADLNLCVVHLRRHWARSRMSGHCRNGRPRFGRHHQYRSRVELLSSIPRQLPASPMVILARRVEHSLNMTVQASHDTYPGEHRRAVMFRNQQERRHRSLPFLRIVLSLGQFGDVERGVAERDRRLLVWDHDRIEKPLIPRHAALVYTSRSVS
jgi:hypothetical protein